MSEQSTSHRGSGNLPAIAARRVHQPHANTRNMSTEEVARLVYELEIHREALEIQNAELRRVQLELKNSRDRYCDFYEFAPVGYLTLNSAAEIVAANLTACDMLGHERAELIGMSLARLCDPDCSAELLAHLNEVSTTGQRRSTELRFTVDQAFDARLETCRSASDDDEGHLTTVITDITARKQAERAAHQTHRHLRSVTDALPVLIGYLDNQLRIQFSNAAYQAWFGCSSEELRGRRIQDLFGDGDQGLADYLGDVLDGHRVDFESRLTHQQDGERRVQVIFVPDIGPDRKVQGIHSLCIDVTERKLIEEQMSRRRQFAELLIRLTAPEKDVYRLLVRGLSNKAISAQLDIGLRTAERRRQTVLEKLQVDSVADLLQHLADIQSIGPDEGICGK
jgi:PAS domain S-box-containing protein